MAVAANKVRPCTASEVLAYQVSSRKLVPFVDDMGTPSAAGEQQAFVDLRGEARSDVPSGSGPLTRIEEEPSEAGGASSPTT